MHIGLVKINNVTKGVDGVHYMNSKFERELGDRLTIDGVSWRVGVIGDDRNSIIDALNVIVRRENKITRAKNRATQIETNRFFNSIVGDLRKYI